MTSPHITPRVRRVRRHGAKLLILENRNIRITVWPEFGAAILGFEDLARGIDVMWKNPLLQPPRNSLLAQPISGHSDIFDVLDGSWFISLPTGWFPVDYFGAPIGSHGEFRVLPFETEVVEEGRQRVRVKVTCRSVRTPFVLERTWELGRDSEVLGWEETLINRSEVARPCAWLHHPTFSGELIQGAELHVPARTIATYDFEGAAVTQLKQGYSGPWPHVPELRGGRRRDCSRVPAGGSGLDHSVQMTNFAVGWACVWNAAMRRGFALRWDEKFFPWAWSWARGGGGGAGPSGEGYPFWGHGHLVTIQPSTSPVGRFPELVAAGHVVMIPAGGSVSTRLLTGFTSRPDDPWNLD